MEHIDFGWLEAIADPLERTVHTHRELDRYQEAATELQRRRREGIEGLIASGMTAKDVAQHLGVSQQRVGQIIKAGPPPAHGVLGRGPAITVAMAQKTEAPKPSGRAGPTVATEDLEAYEILRRLAQDCRFDARSEVIAPPGMVDTNRDGLVVACGPRLSPVLAQMLQGDPVLGFSQDEQGWFLQDQQQERIYRSGSEEGREEDVAYLGRLPRLDGRGAFLYMAGVHSAGIAGAAHWLSQHLDELYAQVGTEKLFSTLIHCSYATSPWRVTSSERITPIYLRGGAT